jgi:hypothetical protein
VMFSLAAEVVSSRQQLDMEATTSMMELLRWGTNHVKIRGRLLAIILSWIVCVQVCCAWSFGSSSNRVD